jgi:DNA-binding transcriptional regulator GbsR (MarR family)
MELQEGKDKFIQAWGTLGSSWGINRTMAQVHALLLVSNESLSAEDIMTQLKISRGNANMNIRALIDWGLAHKELKQGERKEFFVAEKEIWEMMRQIILNRKKKELEPALKVLSEIIHVEGESKEEEEFRRVVTELKMFSEKADVMLEQITKSQPSWMLGKIMNLMK